MALLLLCGDTEFKVSYTKAPTCVADVDYSTAHGRFRIYRPQSAIPYPAQDQYCPQALAAEPGFNPRSAVPYATAHGVADPLERDRDDDIG